MDLMRRECVERSNPSNDGDEFAKRLKGLGRDRIAQEEKILWRSEMPSMPLQHVQVVIHRLRQVGCRDDDKRDVELGEHLRHALQPRSQKRVVLVREVVLAFDENVEWFCPTRRTDQGTGVRCVLEVLQVRTARHMHHDGLSAQIEHGRR